MTKGPSKKVVDAIYTIGYEGRGIDEFILLLQKYRIKVLIDIREAPASRKKDFSKKPLSEHLASVGIRYIHVRELGSPGELRKKVSMDNDYDYFNKEYRKHLDNNSDIFQNLIRETISSETSCLMCMERLPEQCHRKIVAERIRDIIGGELQIRHI